MKIHLTIPFEEVFPETPRSIRALTGLLGQLNRSEALILCAQLNRVLGDPFVHDAYAKQSYAVSHLLLDEDATRINQYIRREGLSFRDIHVFTRAGCLELIRWVAISSNNHAGTDSTALETRRRFGKAAMLASDLWQDRVLVGRLTTDNKDIEIARLRSMGAIRQDVADATYTVDPLRTMGRGRQIYRLLPEIMPDFEGLFEANTGLTLQEYYQCLVVLTGFYWMGTEAKPPDWSRAPASLEIESFCRGIPAFARYLELEAQTPDELCESLWGDIEDPEEAVKLIDSFDYKELRKRPLLKTSDGQFIILDPVFFAEKASVGPLFHLLGSGSNANDIFAAFGKSVEVYAQNILHRMYPSHHGLVERLAAPLMGQASNNNSEVEIADACLNDIEEVVLFQIKARWIRDEYVLDEEYERFLEHLRERYGEGIQQLAVGITRLALQEWLPLDQNLSAARRIYPVLVTYDPILSIMPFTHFFATEFKKSLQPDISGKGQDMRKGQFNVTLPILISLEMLENLETSIQYFALRSLLSDYVAQISEPVISLNDFIASSSYRDKLHRNEKLDDEFTAALEVLNDLMTDE